MLDIAFDVDCVLANTRKHIVDMAGLDVDWSAPGPFEVEDWLPEYAEEIRDLMNRPEFWLTLPVMDGAHEGIQLARDRNADITCITSPYKTCPMWYDFRIQWLDDKFNIKQNNVVVTKKKYPYAAKRFVDDSIENIILWEQANPNGRAYLFTAPHNVTLTRLQRVDWSTIDRIF